MEESQWKCEGAGQANVCVSYHASTERQSSPSFCSCYRLLEDCEREYSSEDNLWSTLYLTGYLTKAREEDYKGELPDGISFYQKHWYSRVY